MWGSSIIRGVSLAGVALLALGTSGPAMAGGKQGEPPPVNTGTYSGPPIVRNIPGLRLLFGDYTLTEEEYNKLFEKKKKKPQIDESYYEPQPAAPAKPKPAKPAASTVTAPAKQAAPANPALPQKTASAGAAPNPAGGAPLSCEKATEVVSGFGFSSVEASSCSGKLYAFNAKRGGRSFAIKLDPASGEITEVKKLP
ncbi:MAG: hypothetical protein IOC82_12710 [Aestuariivirga sp.]|uniref:hypothetical protein n=1 Tax=Aestuariivirga sp. TaxID=2650926 RepID=UPI0025B86351|nr:hypothetical protein [Aestuariivirga sp.]MCA3561879.1 hypothetical protein [Aestuariivirga sp.]